RRGADDQRAHAADRCDAELCRQPRLPDRPRREDRVWRVVLDPRVDHAPVPRIQQPALRQHHDVRILSMRVITAIVAAALLFTSPAVPLSAQTVADYIIGPQDVLLIQVFDQPDLGGKYTVEADGTFTFPLIGRIKAGALTLRGFEHDLKERLADG